MNYFILLLSVSSTWTPSNCKKRQAYLKLDIGYSDHKFMSNFKFYKFSGKAFLLLYIFISDIGFEGCPKLILEDVIENYQ